MGRVARLRVRLANDRFQRTYKTCGIASGSQEETALKAAIGRLRWKRLPLPGDYEVPMLPLAEVIRWGHDVAGTSLRLVYDFDDEHLFLVSVTRRQS